jgi:hypothetical protein
MFKRNLTERMGGHLIVSPQTPAFTKIAKKKTKKSEIYKQKINSEIGKVCRIRQRILHGEIK